MNKFNSCSSNYNEGVINLHKEEQQDESPNFKDFSEIEKLVENYEDMLYNLCYRLTLSTHDAQDLYQQTWLRAIQKFHLFTIKSMKNWLYTICLNLYRDGYCKNKRKDRIINRSLTTEAQEWAMENATDNVSAENAAIDNIQGEILQQKIEQLSDKLRVPIILYYFDGLSYKEIAQIIRIPIGTVKSRLSLAKNQLRKEMESDCNV